MTDVAKVLAEMREAALAALTDPDWHPSASSWRKQKLSTALAGFTADMLEDISKQLRHYEHLLDTVFSDKDQYISIADLEAMLCKKVELLVKADKRIAELEEAATMRKVADAGIGTVPIGIKLLEQLNQRIAELEGENREAVAVLALLRLHRLQPEDEPIPSDLLSREDGVLAKLETGQSQ